MRSQYQSGPAPEAGPSALASALPRPGLRAMAVYAAMAGLSLGAGALPPAFAQQAAESPSSVARSYAIGAGALSDVLARFAASSGVQLVFDPAVLAGHGSPGLQGRYTVPQGFDALLEGTGLRAQGSANGGYSLQRVQELDAGAGPGADTHDALPEVLVSGKAPGSTTEGTGSYTTFSTSSSTRLNLTPQETPQAITVMTRQRMDDQSLYSLSDVLAAIPGIIVQAAHIGEDMDGINIYARGSYLRNYQIDGVPTALAVGPLLSNTAAYDRIEVVRGATGIMNGLGTPAATINLIRKRPTAASQKFVTARVGNWDRHGVGLDISGATNESGTARVRFVADYDQQGAWVKRFDQDNLALYGIAEFDLGDRTQATLGINHMNQKTDSTILGRPLFYTSGERIARWPADDGTPEWAYYDHKSSNLFASLEHRFGTNWVGKVEYSQTRYEDDGLTVGITDPLDAATGSGVEVWPYRWTSSTRQNNLDAYVSGVFPLFGRDHEVIGGVTLSRSRSSTDYYDDDWANYPTDFNIHDWTNTAPVPTFFEAGQGRSRERNYSAYLNARFQIGDATSLLLGGRSVHWQLNESSDMRKANEFVPYVGLVHAFNDTWSAYGSYTKIFQPQDGVVYLYGIPGASPDPEQGEGYEAGIKASLNDGQLTASLAVFQMDVANLAFWNREIRFYEVLGETRTRGVELELNGELAQGWQASAGYAFARTEDENGQRALTRLPLHSLKVFTSYRLPGAWNQLTVGGGVNWQSAISSGVSTLNYRQGSVAQVNLMARYEVDKNLSVALHVNNALNKHYFSTVANNYSTYGAPRNFMISAKYNF